jgi:hypothetical protein
MTEAPKPKPPKYRVKVGINWPDGKGGERRAEPGKTLTAIDLKGAAVEWLLDIGALEPVEGGEG